jgi:hypothetical protein
MTPPADPAHCTFARVSVNYSADLESRIEPCFFGGNPDCSRCGCAVSAGLHWLYERPLALGLRAGHLIDWSLQMGGHAPRRTRDRNRRAFPSGPPATAPGEPIQRTQSG